MSATATAQRPPVVAAKPKPAVPLPSPKPKPATGPPPPVAAKKPAVPLPVTKPKPPKPPVKAPAATPLANGVSKGAPPPIPSKQTVANGEIQGSQEEVVKSSKSRGKIFFLFNFCVFLFSFSSCYLIFII